MLSTNGQVRTHAGRPCQQHVSAVLGAFDPLAPSRPLADDARRLSTSTRLARTPLTLDRAGAEATPLSACTGPSRFFASSVRGVG